MDKTSAADHAQTAVKEKSCFLSDFESSIIRITVEDGEDSKDFYIHKQLLFRKSEYFAAMSNFKEGDENHIVLKDIKHDAFHHILHWFYCDILDPDIDQDFEDLMHTWIAADRLILIECKNIVMDSARRDYVRNGYDERHAEAAVSLGFSKDHPFIRFILDQLAWDCVYGHGDMGEFAETIDTIPQELIKPLLENVRLLAQELKRRECSARQNNRYAPSERKGCLYHEHIAGVTCYTKNDTAE